MNLPQTNLIESTWRALERSAAEQPHRASPQRVFAPAVVLVASVATIMVAALLPLTSFVDPSGASLILYPPWTDERAAMSDVIDAGGLLIGLRSDLPLGIVGVAAAFPPNGIDAHGLGGHGLQLPLFLPFGCTTIAGSAS